LLSKHNVISDKYVVFAPGSAREHKCWPTERFAALADKITSQFGLPTVAVGTASEKNIIDNLEELANVPIANLAGKTGLRELTALLRATQLVVANDTGPGHIAAALGVPLVLIFGPTNPVRVAPYGRDHCVVAVDPDGRGTEPNSTNPEHNIKAVKLDDVYQKVCEQLKQKEVPKVS
jgi:ADP-heptose:LPS heptosyltransferase